ncbi:hypothetical protein [Paenibacillus sp. Mc5Re-14]|uniref:hypothetical protein n=1 Tax=Paenibacillus sp. Mc5Re-14 TaxID=1030529 RepID=UPI000B1D8705|nr:hypothetical protein [Paenibacillus sp. Mc5Re-14]
MGNESCGLSVELIEMGFKGLLLKRLMTCIVDYATLQEFHNFIILREEELMTKVLLVHEFISHMQNKNSFDSGIIFITQYEEAETQEEKEFLICKLMNTENPLVLKKVSTLFSDNMDKLPALYDRVVRYRKMYKPDEIVALLGILPT